MRGKHHEYAIYLKNKSTINQTNHLKKPHFRDPGGVEYGSAAKVDTLLYIK